MDKLRAMGSAAALFAAVSWIAFGLGAPKAAAQVASWIGDGDGVSWDDPDNWDPNVPMVGDDVEIVGDGEDVSVTFQNPEGAFGTLSLSGINDGSASLEQSQDTLDTVQSRVGDGGIGFFTQDGGVHDTDLLSVGIAAGEGTYDLLDGTLTAGDIEIGVDISTGAMTQSGGVVTVAGGLTVSGLNSIGSYELGGGMLSVGTAVVGSEGLADFLQTGGDFSVDTDLVIGDAADGDGILTFGGGTLSVGGLTIVGNSGFGQFDQNADLVLPGGLVLGRQTDGRGTYNLNSGVTLEDGLIIGDAGFGEFFNDSGTHVVTDDPVLDGNGVEVRNLVLGNQELSEGDYFLSGTGSLEVQGDGVDTGHLIVGDRGAGLFDQDGADTSVSVAGQLIIGNQEEGNGEYLLNDGTLETGSNILIGGGFGGANVLGTFSQHGGTVTAGDEVFVGNFDGTGQLNIDGGTFDISDPMGAVCDPDCNPVLWVGNTSSGTVQQDGGTVMAGFVNVGTIFGDGTYNITDGELSSFNLGIGGLNSTGSFGQTGGTVDIDNLFLNGDGTAATGTYQLEGGMLDVAGDAVIGGFSSGAEFDQSGGSAGFGSLTIGDDAGVDGRYFLSGGTVEVAGAARVGDQGDGTLAISGTGSFTGLGGQFALEIASQVGSSGEVTVTDTGSLTTNGRLVVGLAGTASLTQDGDSTVTTQGLRLGNIAGSSGTYTLESGTLDVLSTGGVGGGARIGITGEGSNTSAGPKQTGGAILGGIGGAVAGAQFGQGSGGTGTVTLNDGTLTATGNIVVREPLAGTAGTLNIAGGALSAAAIINNDEVNYSGGSIAANVTNRADFNVLGGAPRTLTGNLTNESALDVSAGSPFTITGTLANSAAGTIAAGDDIAVGLAYNNAAFGEGNAFDHRASVTGAGDIIGIDAAQAITGTAVTDGTTATPTLDLGFVHVGDTSSESYQIANSGTGAQIQGAIQTSVNGGNVTSGDLSGSGVTAQNWGPVDAGASTSDFAVDFTPTAAGALAGQAVHIENNFDNVADQTIAITGAGIDFANPVIAASLDFGNVLVGSMQMDNIEVTNQVVSNAAFQELLNVAFQDAGMPPAGIAELLGSILGLAPGATDDSSLKVTLDTSTVGAVNAIVTLALESDGTAFGLGLTSLGTQDVTVVANIEGLVGELAEAQVTPTAIDFGEFHVTPGSQSQGIDITNVTAIGEGLDASLGPVAGDFTTTDQLPANIAAGDTLADAVTVTIDTGVAGSKAGTVQLDFESDGSFNGGVTTPLDSQIVTVAGTGFALAEGQVDQPAIDLGAVHVGDLAKANIAVTNVGPDTGGFTESLDAALTGVAGGTASGSPVAGVAQGATNSDLMLTVDTSAAGAQSATATVDFASNGDGLNSLGVTDIADGAVAVTVDVFNLAEAAIAPTTVDLGARRVGDPDGLGAAEETVTISNVAPAGAFTEGLDAAVGAAPSGFALSGDTTVTNLDGGASADFTVALDTTTSGAFSGDIDVDFASNGANSGLASTALGSETVAVSGKVYQAAEAQLDGGTAIDFGTVRVGDAVADITRTLTNAAAGALVDQLTGGFAPGPAAPFSADGGGLGAGLASGAMADLAFGLDTSTAGIFGDTASLALASHNDDMADLALAALDFALTGTVNNLAAPEFLFQSGDGALTGGGTLFTLDFGTILETSDSLLEANLSLINAATGPADLLDGLFDLGGISIFDLAGFGIIDDLAVGDMISGLMVSFDSSLFGPGIFMESFFFDPTSVFLGLADVALDPVEFRISARIVAEGVSVPEPASWASFGAGLLLLFGLRRRRVRNGLNG